MLLHPDSATALYLSPGKQKVLLLYFSAPISHDHRYMNRHPHPETYPFFGIRLDKKNKWSSERIKSSNSSRSEPWRKGAVNPLIHLRPILIRVELGSTLIPRILGSAYRHREGGLANYLTQEIWAKWRANRPGDIHWKQIHGFLWILWMTMIRFSLFLSSLHLVFSPTENETVLTLSPDIPPVLSEVWCPSYKSANRRGASYSFY